MKLSGKIAKDGIGSVSEPRQMVGGHKVPRIWILTADRHHVRVFSKPNGHLEEIAAAAPSSRDLEPGMTNDAIGRGASSASGVIHHKLEPRTSPEEKESRAFAQDIAQWLDDAVGKDAFDRLVIAAAPHMLGDLRKAMNKHVQDRIVAEVDKDLVKMDDRELFAELEKIVWF